MSHSLEVCCPNCGSRAAYPLPAPWRVYTRQMVGGRKLTFLAFSRGRVFRCRGCGVAFDCFPRHLRSRLRYCFPISESALRRFLEQPRGGFNA
jgi:hypothetical protein